jgi:cell division septal protein FtsQ
MEKNRGKILSIILFMGLISFLFYLVLVPKKIAKRNIDKIEISGNKFLTENNYLKQTKLSNPDSYEGLTLSIIKDRVEKHPYIIRADVELIGKEVKVFIKEKKMRALIKSGTQLYFVSDALEILPFKPDTKLVNLPVISNPGDKGSLKLNTFVKDDNVIEAVKIIETADLIDDKMVSHLSEINLRNGGDIIITFSGYPVPVIFGKGNSVRKIVYLESLWREKNLNEMIKNTGYLDLRFAGNIYAGDIQNTGSFE